MDGMEESRCLSYPFLCACKSYLIKRDWKFELHTNIAYDPKLCHYLDPRLCALVQRSLCENDALAVTL